MTDPGFALLIENLDSIGAFDVFLPLLLFLAIYFGLLMKTEVIGDDEVVIGVASLSLGLITVFGAFTFVPADFFPHFFGMLSMVLIGILALVLALGMTGVDFSGEQDQKIKFGVAALGAVVVFFGAPAVFQAFFAGGADAIGPIEISEEMMSWIVTMVLLVITGGVVWLLVKGSGE